MIFQAALGGKRAEIGLLVEGIADFKRFHGGHETLLKFLGNRLRDDKSLGVDAGLAIVEDARFHGRGDRFVEIGAGHHDERVAAAEFQHDFLNALGRAHSDVIPAPSLPVSVAAATRGSLRIESTLAAPISSV